MENETAHDTKNVGNVSTENIMNDNIVRRTQSNLALTRLGSPSPSQPLSASRRSHSQSNLSQNNRPGLGTPASMRAPSGQQRLGSATLKAQDLFKTNSMPNQEYFDDDYTPPHTPRGARISTGGRSPRSESTNSNTRGSFQFFRAIRPPSGSVAAKREPSPPISPVPHYDSPTLEKQRLTSPELDSSIREVATNTPAALSPSLLKPLPLPPPPPPVPPLTSHEATILDILHGLAGGGADEAKGAAAHGDAKGSTDVGRASYVKAAQSLRQLVWRGCPPRCRYACWCLLADYWTPQTLASSLSIGNNNGSQPSTTALATLNHAAIPTRLRRVTEYRTILKQSYDSIPWGIVLGTAIGSVTTEAKREAYARISAEEIAMMKQIRKDIPRTSLGGQYNYHTASTAVAEEVLERTPYVWALLAQGQYLSGTSMQFTTNQSLYRSLCNHPAATAGPSSPPKMDINASFPSAYGSMSGSSFAQAPSQQPTPLFRHGSVQAMLQRVLYLWALRHPACGYVQGMNDLLVPIVVVSLAEALCFAALPAVVTRSVVVGGESGSQYSPDADMSIPYSQNGDAEVQWLVTAPVEDLTIRMLQRGLLRPPDSATSSSRAPINATKAQLAGSYFVPTSLWFAIEADVYALFTRMMNTIQVNFTTDAMLKKDQRQLDAEAKEGADSGVFQGGSASLAKSDPSSTAGSMHAMVTQMEDIVRRAHPQLHQALTSLQIKFSFFAFKWMNCMLQRELCPPTLGMRLLDTYWSEYSAGRMDASAGPSGEAQHRDPMGTEESTGSSTAILDYHCYVCASLLIHAYAPILFELLEPKGAPPAPLPIVAKTSFAKKAADAGAVEAESSKRPSTTRPRRGSIDDSSRRSHSQSVAGGPPPAARIDLDEANPELKDLISSAMLTILQNPAMLLSFADTVNGAAAAGMRWAGEAVAGTDPSLMCGRVVTIEAAPRSSGLSPTGTPNFASPNDEPLSVEGAPAVPPPNPSYATPQTITLIRRRFDEILSEAYLLQQLYQNSPAQLGSGTAMGAGGTSPARGPQKDKSTGSSLASSFASLVESISEAKTRRETAAVQKGSPTDGTAPQKSKKDTWISNWFGKK